MLKVIKVIKSRLRKKLNRILLKKKSSTRVRVTIMNQPNNSLFTWEFNLGLILQLDLLMMICWRQAENLIIKY
jgi:hypothetical protein